MRFLGTGFTFDASGQPTGGLVTDIINTPYKTVAERSITGISVPLTTLYAAAVQGAGVTLLPGLLSGNDTVETTSNLTGALLNGYGGDDRFRTDVGVNIDGGAGADTVEFKQLLREAVTVTGQPGTLFATLSPSFISPPPVSALTSVEAIGFLDGTLKYSPATTGGQVYLLFQAALGRAPDAGALGYYTDAATRYGLPAVASGLLAAPEVQARLGGLDDAGFINAAYRSVLGRDAEPGGLQYWQGQIGAGGGRAGVLTTIAASDEATAHNAAQLAPGIFGADPQAVAVDRVILAATGALPNAAMLAYDTTRPLNELETFYARNGLSDADFVASLIRNSYGATVTDPGAVAYYTQALAHGGGTRADVVNAYASSPGIDVRVAPYVTDRGVLHA